MGKVEFRTHFKTFKVERADHIAQPGMIDSQVISRLIEADLVVADLTTRNANAFYELGIRHMLQMPIIHLFKRGEKIPADVAPYRATEFSYEQKRDITEAKIALRKVITEALNPNTTVENPVTRSAGFIRMEHLAAQERGHVAAMAAGLRKPVEDLHKKLRVLAQKTVNVQIKPTYFNELSAPLDNFDKQWNELVIAIASFGTKHGVRKKLKAGSITITPVPD
jgi:hypothetical protein